MNATASEPQARIPGWRRVRYFIEYLGIRLGHGLMQTLPLPLSSAFARGLADASFVLMRKRRATTIDNVLKAGMASTPQQAARIARDSFRHFAVLMVESIAAERLITAENWRTHVDVSEAQELLEMAAAPGAGFLVETAHFGNWEVPAQVLSQYKPMAAVARRMNNPYTDEVVQGRKTGKQFRTILKDDATGSVLLDVLKGGQIVAMLIDQHTRYRGMLVPFFGRPAACHTAAAILHLRSGIPLAFAYGLRVGPLQFKLVCPRIFRRGDSAARGEQAVVEIIEQTNLLIEEAVRRHPEQYLWAHRRWRADRSYRLRVPEKYAGLAPASATKSAPV